MCAEMRLWLAPDSKHYQKAIYDVMRIFAPNFLWAEPSGDSLEVSVIDEEARMIFVLGDERYELDVTGLDHNERSRALKATMYSVFKERLHKDASHWGILTGIRPTKIVHRYWDAGLSASEIMAKLTEDYLVEPQKAALLVQVTQAQRPFLLSREAARQMVSIYICIPFCPTRCSYCSFPSYQVPKPQLLTSYLTHLTAEIRAVSQAIAAKGQVVQTVYIGGGTPTTLSSDQLRQLLSVIMETLGQQGLAEFTVEAGRPDTIDREKLEVLKAYAVDRISINPQTMWEPTLAVIGRQHTVADIIEKFQLARLVGIKRINMDLIIGLPGETAEHFSHTLEQMRQLQPENLTVHTLARKRASRLTKEQSPLSDSAVVEEMAARLQAWLPGQAYEPYYLYRQKQMVANLENVGYTLPGQASLYNIQMMEERQTIYGLGVGSASKYVHPTDWTLDAAFNPKDLLLYNERITSIISKKVAAIQAL